MALTDEDSPDIKALKSKIVVLEKENESFEEETISLKAQKRYFCERGGYMEVFCRGGY